MQKIYDVELYVKPSGDVPFKEWLGSLKDKRLQAKIYARIDRASFGNFGDWKKIKGTQNLFEMREHSGAGYRIYYSIVGQKIIVLLSGSDKQDQDKVIAQSITYLQDYHS